MTAEQYLKGILDRNAVDTTLFSPVRTVQLALTPMLQHWGNGYLLGVSPSGSFAKGTANKSGTDIDLFLSVRHESPGTLRQIYDTLFNACKIAGYTPRKQNVSINIKVNSFDVDLVPGRSHGPFTTDHSLYRRKHDTWTQTNIQRHVTHVVNSSRQREIRLTKLWRTQNSLEFPSFYLELTVIRALNGHSTNLADNFWRVLEYIRDDFAAARIIDPSNTNNVVSDELNSVEKSAIVNAASTARRAKTWGEILR